MKHNVLFSLVLGMIISINLTAQTVDRPNIVLILADDMGFSDLGSYGGTIIETPNLDKLADDGIRFSQFYNMARCCPTRASLLTGLYPHQTGVGFMEAKTHGEDAPGYLGHLNTKCVTLAEAIGESGYLTSHSGKWHVGARHGVNPWNRGFMRSLSSIKPAFYYAESEYAKTLHYNGKPISPFSDELPKNWYSTDLYAEFGLRFIDEALNKEKPFFLYLAFNAPHFPLQAPKETIKKYKGKFSEGWDELRKDVYNKQVKSGLIDEKWELSEKHPDVPDWNNLSSEHTERMEHIQEIYAACVERMDKAVGTVVNGLKERGVLKNTIIVFLSDNGACAEQGPYGRHDGIEKSGTVDSNVFQGQSWATFSNTPFRRYKHFTTEGGISTPCIISWPDGISAKRNGSIEHSYGTIMDIMPTFIEIANASYPNEYKGHSILPMEGESLLPIFKGEKLKRDAPICWEHEGNRAVRNGKWKIVSFNHKPWQLFNIKKDRTETFDLSRKHPIVFNKLKEEWENWAKRCNVEPWPGGKNSAGQSKSIEKKYQIR